MSQIPYTPENVKLIHKVAEFLEGTCKSLEDGLEQYFGADVGTGEMDIELLRELDSLVLECQGCNWWCEAGEMDDESGEPLCADCREDTN